MAKSTGIIWAKSTFNAWTGCTKVGPGCDHCYAEAMMDKRLHVVQWGPGKPRKRTSPANWRQPLKWNREAPDSEFMGRKGFWPVFVNSASDVFDNEVDPQWRADLFALIRATPNLTWLLLTKRIGNAAKMLDEVADKDPATLFDWPLPNVWIGATVVNQEEADRDIPKLLAVPAAKRFLSIEPMLGPVDLTKVMRHEPDAGRDGDGGWTFVDDVLTGWRSNKSGGSANKRNAVDWVIAGGESGPQSRPAHPDWFKSIRDQCKATGVPFLFKQWGEWAPLDHFPSETQEDYELRGIAEDGVVRAGTKAAGNHLDGRQHIEFPK